MIESVEEFIRLRTSEEPEEYWRAAHGPATLEVWYSLLNNHPEMRFWVAQNKTVPLEVLECLVKDDDPKVRSMVAMKRKLPVKLQKLLATDPDDGVRYSLVCNASVLSDVLKIMATGTDWVAAEAKKRIRLKGDIVS